ncbi:hypothetical protein JZ751_016487 [Albula glossodonta]|uniref:Uncharacterized protein n=1 Tax=Albula glossodonta TaxID=121402 RepID=A0A8T2NQU7_9TELE|nr:hypothetical protein JZ751_016487 [Albula glossodonta]
MYHTSDRPCESKLGTGPPGIAICNLRPATPHERTGIVPFRRRYMCANAASPGRGEGPSVLCRGRGGPWPWQPESAGLGRDGASGTGRPCHQPQRTPAAGRAKSRGAVPVVDTQRRCGAGATRLC